MVASVCFCCCEWKQEEDRKRTETNMQAKVVDLGASSAQKLSIRSKTLTRVDARGGPWVLLLRVSILSRT